MGSAEFLSPVSDRPSTGPRAYPRIMREARPNEQRHARRQRAGQRPDAVRLDPLPLCHPVGLRPHTDGSRSADVPIVCFNVTLTVQEHVDPCTVELDLQQVPAIAATGASTYLIV